MMSSCLGAALVTSLKKNRFRPPCTVPAPNKLDSFHLVDKNGSTIQSSCKEKAATIAAFLKEECEPDWTNLG